MADRIPDEAIVLRGGRNRAEDVRRGTGTHPSGVTGISVECDVGVPLDELGSAIPHGQVGMTTVGAIRAAGGDVVRTEPLPRDPDRPGRGHDQPAAHADDPEPGAGAAEHRRYAMTARLYADFQNADPQGRIRLNSLGTVEDLGRLGLQLSPGLVVSLYADDQDDPPTELETRGVVEFSEGERCWVARIDWSAIRRVPAGAGNGAIRPAVGSMPVSDALSPPAADGR